MSLGVAILRFPAGLLHGSRGHRSDLSCVGRGFAVRPGLQVTYRASAKGSGPSAAWKRPLEQMRGPEVGVRAVPSVFPRKDGRSRMSSEKDERMRATSVTERGRALVQGFRWVF